MNWSPNDPEIRRHVAPRQLAGSLDGFVEGVAGHWPVPVTIWRAAPAAARVEAAADPRAGGLTAWLAHRLVATYTRSGGTIVDFDADPALRQAAAASSCGYLPVTAAADLTRLDTSGDVDLITLRWPRPQPVADAALTDVFRACRLVLGRRGHTAVIVEAATDQPPLDHGRDLLPAATAGGMEYLRHIIAVLGPGQPDTAAVLEPANHAGQVQARGRIRVSVEMLIFVVGGQGDR
jgi:hypothetical protein